MSITVSASAVSTSNIIAFGQLLAGVVGTTALVWSLLMLRRQIILQRDALQHQNSVWEFEIYQRIDNRVADLVWKQSEDSRLSMIFVPLAPDEERALDEAQATGPQWGAWRTLDEHAKTNYRFVRIFLEALEQMYEVRARSWIPDEMWQKWAGWIEAWVDMRYAKYVFEDQRPVLIPGFAALLQDAINGPIGQQLVPFHNDWSTGGNGRWGLGHRLDDRSRATTRRRATVRIRREGPRST